MDVKPFSSASILRFNPCRSAGQRGVSVVLTGVQPIGAYCPAIMKPEAERERRSLRRRRRRHASTKHRNIKEPVASSPPRPGGDLLPQRLFRPSIGTTAWSVDERLRRRRNQRGITIINNNNDRHCFSMDIFTASSSSSLHAKHALNSGC